MNNDFKPDEFTKYRGVLEMFPGEQKIKSDTNADVLCPVHGDTHPSLGIDLRQNGKGPKIVFNYRSRGCSFEEIREAVGLKASDYEFSTSDSGMNGSANHTEISGCTLEKYAAAKNLPVKFLSRDDIGLENCTWWNVDAMAIPYPDVDGEILVYRYRVALSGKTKVVSKKGDTVHLYGLHSVEDCRAAGFAFVLEGESDCHTAWFHGIPAIGVPGAKNWKDEWADFFDGIDLLIVPIEDKAGEELWKKLSGCEKLAGRLERTVIE